MILFESVGPNLFVRNIAMKTIVLLSYCSAATLLCSDHSYPSDPYAYTFHLSIGSFKRKMIYEN